LLRSSGTDFRDGTVVVFEEPAEALAALHFTGRERQDA
jgi:hypothetical protein